MSSFTRMKKIFLDGLIWLFLLQYGFMALSLEPGFLDFDNLPDTNFSCHGKVIGGYYADVETNCQMFHVCTKGQAGENMDIRFLCLNGTVFDQETRVCERIDEVDCSKSEQFYSLNLELYQHSGQNSEDIPEVSQETEPPTKPTTTTTTSSTKSPTAKPSTSQYFTTSRPLTATAAANTPQSVSGHHFPVNAPDIRFNPEEINISLNPGAPPDIRTKHFQLSQSFSDSSEVSQNDEKELERLSASTSPKSVYAIDSDSDKLPQNSDANFGFIEENFRSTEGSRQPQPQFLIQTNSFRHSQSFPPNVNHNSHQYHHPQFHSTTVKQSGNFPSHTTSRTIYLHSLKPPQVHQHHHYTHHPRTEKTPQRVQIPIPLLPTLPPLTFSSPAPFALHHHIDSKRYTKEHQSPPRIIISASASVSDASGRRLNYSLGTIGAAQILDTPPSSYDEYKDGDVGLDPFYHDVPKIPERARRRRSVDEKQINPFEIIKNEKEAVQVLKFLFTWYQSHQATATVPPVTSPVSLDLIQTINNELAPRIEEIALNPESSEIHYTNSKEATSTESMSPDHSYDELFKGGGRFGLVGGPRNENGALDSLARNDKKLSERMDVDEKSGDAVQLKHHVDHSDIIVKDFKELPFNTHDYVDDNYEGVAYKQNSATHENNNFDNGKAPEGTPKANETVGKSIDAALDKIVQFEVPHSQGNHEMPKTEDQIPTTTAPNRPMSKRNEDHFQKKVDNVVGQLQQAEFAEEHNKTNQKAFKIEYVEDKEADKESPKTKTEHSEEHKETAGAYREEAAFSRTVHPINHSTSSIHNIKTEKQKPLDNLRNQKETSSNKVRHFIDPSAADQLFKYFNVNQLLTTEATSVSSKASTTEPEVHNSNVTRGDSSSNSLLDEGTKVEYTEINVLSEVREEDSVSSRATSTTTTVSPPKHRGGRRRGGIRQRQLDSHQAASYNVPSAHNNRESLNYIANSQNKPAVRRGRNRGRSRFGSQPVSSTTEGTTTTTTTDPSPVVTTPPSWLNSETSAHYFEATTLTAVTENARSELPEVSTVSIKADEEVATPYNMVLEVTESELTDSYPELLATISVETPTTPSTMQDTSDFFHNTVTTETSTEPLSPTGENPREPISELNPSVSTTASYLIKLLKHFAESDDSAIYAPFTTESPTSYDPLTETQMTSLPYFVTPSQRRHQTTARLRSRYRHSSRVSSTELPTLRDIYSKNAPLDKETELLEVSTTHTVHDIKSKTELLNKLSMIEQNLSRAGLSTTEAAVTTSAAHSERSPSDGTDSTKLPETTAAFQEFSKIFQVKAHGDYSSYYDDVFVVPELTGENSAQSRKQTSTTEANTLPPPNEVITDLSTTLAASTVETTTNNLDLNEALSTTLLPDVEIQKSISLPVSILDVSYPTNDAHNINGLLADYQHETSTSFPTELSTSSPFALTETVPVTTELLVNTTKYADEHLTSLQDTTMRQVGENFTEIIFVKSKDFNLDQSVGLKNPNSSHLYQVVLESSTEQPIASTRVPYYTRKTRPPRRRPYSSSKAEFGRHRFNTELLTNKPTITDAPLLHSAIPTKTRELKKVLLHTTPLSSKSPRTSKVNRLYVFNCFGKETNRFYADPRDCRLFHYCTNGYSKNQLLDLKYVCDQRTFFDEDRVICTKVKPARCV